MSVSVRLRNERRRGPPLPPSFEASHAPKKHVASRNSDLRSPPKLKSHVLASHRGLSRVLTPPADSLDEGAPFALAPAPLAQPEVRYLPPPDVLREQKRRLKPTETTVTGAASLLPESSFDGVPKAEVLAHLYGNYPPQKSKLEAVSALDVFALEEERAEGEQLPGMLLSNPLASGPGNGTSPSYGIEVEGGEGQPPLKPMPAAAEVDSDWDSPEGDGGFEDQIEGDGEEFLFGVPLPEALLRQKRGLKKVTTVRCLRIHFVHVFSIVYTRSRMGEGQPPLKPMPAAEVYVARRRGLGLGRRRFRESNRRRRQEELC